MGVLAMDKKITGTAYFLCDARRIDDVEEFRKKGNKKRLTAKPYIVEKVITLSEIDYQNFTTDLLADRHFIEDNISLMFVDNNNVWHCLLVVQAGKPETGILVESKKNDFPKYTALYQKPLELNII